MRTTRSTLLLVALALAACGPSEPRYGVVTVSATAPRASLTGHTSATGAPAIELSPGCPGFVDPGVPEHLVRLDDASAVTITARSLRGPLAIAVIGPNEVRCDSDGGTGHAPHATIDQPGEYFVHVGALEAAADLPYELTVAPAAAATDSTTTQGQRVSVTITSDPSGATVRTPEGQALGTTPAMFVLSVPPSEMGGERHFVLEMAGRTSTDVVGRLMGDTLVLHAAMPSAAPIVAPPVVVAPGVPSATGTIEASATSSQRIEDYRVATQSLDVGTACTIARMSVDVDIHHSYIADLRVVLRSPSGTEVVLHDHGGGSRANLVTTYDWDDRRGALHTLLGQSGQGRWTMDVHDDAGADTGSFRAFTVHLTCGDPSAIAATPPVPVTPPVTPRTPRTPRILRPQPPPPVVAPWTPPPPIAPPPPTPLRNGGAGGVVMQPY
jgi:subtilisin-like proprotein convertase family protein